MTSIFPLFKLPFLALREVLYQYEPYEIFYLSFCSNKARLTIKTIKIPYDSFDLDFNVGERYAVSIEYTDEKPFYLEALDLQNLPKDRVTRNMVMGHLVVSIEEGEEGHLQTYWPNKEVGLTVLADYIFNLFDCSINVLSIGSHDLQIMPTWAADWVSSRQKSVEGLYLETTNATPEDINFIFSKIIPTDWLIALDDRKSFGRDDRSPNPRLKNQDLTVLLRHWMNGGFSKLKMMKISIEENLSDHIIVEELDAIPMPHDVERMIDDVDFKSVQGGYDIKRKSDGAILNIGVIEPSNELVLARIPQ